MRPPGCRHTAIKYAPFYTLLSLSLFLSSSFSPLFLSFFPLSRFFSTVRFRARIIIMAQMEAEKGGGRVEDSIVRDKAIKIENEM